MPCCMRCAATCAPVCGLLMLTARLEDKLTGFSHGADDLTKPFALLEVEARLLALIQRAKGQRWMPVRAFGPLQYDTRSRGMLITASRALDAQGKPSWTLMRDPGEVVA